MGVAMAMAARTGRRRGRAGRPAQAQLELEGVAQFPVKKRGRGGKRVGAGRKRAPGVRPSVVHRVRARHDGRSPVLVTLRARGGLPSLRTQRVSAMLRGVLKRQRRRRYARIFQVVELSIQDNHLHLIVEATGVVETGRVDAPEALRAGISGLVIAFAKRLNRMLDRSGKVWGDRYDARDLASPTEVRNALVYVLRNVARHGAYLYGDGIVDPFSSAPRFTGFTRPSRPWFEDPDDTEPWPPASPWTWLLGYGWRLCGLIEPNEVRRRG